MILIFEGCDKVGKSTLVENLRKNTLVDWKIVNYKYPEVSRLLIHDIKKALPTRHEMMVEQFSSYMTSFRIFKDLKVSGVICDRFWVGEFAYCNIRGYEYPKHVEDKWLRKFLNWTHEIGALIIYVKADFEEIEKRMAKDAKGDYIKIQEARMIISEYERVFSILKEIDEYQPSSIIEIDTTNKTKEQSFNELMKNLAKRGVF